MSLAEDLLEQAKFLVHRDPQKPRQASLRRAVSTAYYAVFHLLATSAADQASSATPPALRLRVRRALDHSEMKTAAQSFASSNLPRQIAPLIRGALARELVSVADSFIRLQEDRHKADYDLDIRFDRAVTEEAVARATQVFRDWASVRETDGAKVFLAALMFHKRWNR